MTKKAPGNERKYNTKIWKTDGGERDPYRAFLEYVVHRPQGDKVPGNLFLTPVDKPTTNVWYKAVPLGRNTLAKQMKTIAFITSLDGKFTNLSGRKTVIQSLHHPLKISELTGQANPDLISSYSHNPSKNNEGCQRIKLAWFSSSQPLQLSQLPTPGAVHALKLYEKFMSTALHFHQ